MAKLKAYTLGINGFLPTHVRELLDVPSHVRQGNVIIVATSKREAHALAEDRGFHISLSDSGFRVCDGWPRADALRDFSGRQAVYAMPLDTHAGAAVVEVDDAATAHIIGQVTNSTIEFKEES